MFQREEEEKGLVQPLMAEEETRTMRMKQTPEDSSL